MRNSDDVGFDNTTLNYAAVYDPYFLFFYACHPVSEDSRSNFRLLNKRAFLSYRALCEPLLALILSLASLLSHWTNVTTHLDSSRPWRTAVSPLIAQRRPPLLRV